MDQAVRTKCLIQIFNDMKLTLRQLKKVIAEVSAQQSLPFNGGDVVVTWTWTRRTYQENDHPSDSLMKRYFPGRYNEDKRQRYRAEKRAVFKSLAAAENFEQELYDEADFSAATQAGSGISIQVER